MKHIQFMRDSGLKRRHILKQTCSFSFCITTHHEKVKTVYSVFLTTFLVTLSKQIHVQFQFKFNSRSVTIQMQLPEVFCKMDVLRNFAKLTGKPVPETLFVGQTRPAPLLKKRLQHSCFPVDFTKFLRTPFLIEHLRTTPSDHKNIFINEQTKHF